MSNHLLTRQQLYELVWSTPMTTLEKTYDISANAIRQICKQHNIPLPKSGHWMKVQFGLEVTQDSLPDSQDTEEIIVLKKKEQKEKQTEIVVLPVEQQVLKEQPMAPDIQQTILPVVPERLTKPDPLIELQKKLSQLAKKEIGILLISICKTMP